MIHALKNANDVQRTVLMAAMKGDESTHEEIDSAVKVLTELGSIDYARSEAAKYLETAIRSIEELEDTAAKKQLIELVNYFVLRDY